MTPPIVFLDQLALGAVPRVVGTLATLPAGRGSISRFKAECDLVELRLDLIGPEKAWEGFVEHLRQEGLPTLLTIRLEAEGGRWRGTETDRHKLLTRRSGSFSGIDLELSSPNARALARQMKSAGKVLIVSYHNFERTPSAPELRKVVEDASEFASLVKIVTRVNAVSDLKIFASLLKTRWPVPLCLMGMGPLGISTRKSLPLLGSALTYGYLDRPVAPNQPAAKELLRYFAHRGARTASSTASRSHLKADRTGSRLDGAPRPSRL